MGKTEKSKTVKPPIFVRWLEPKRDTVYRREPALTIKALWLQYLKKRALVALMWLLWATWFIGILFVPSYDSHNHAADARARISASISAESTLQGRRQLATQILAGYNAGVHSDINAGSDTAQHHADILRQLKRTEKTGTPVVFDTRHDSRMNHPWNTSKSFALVFFAVGSIGLSVRYAFRTMVKAEFLADLPWKQGWPFAFVALMPLLVPAFIVSALRFYRLKDTERKTDDEDSEPAFAFKPDEEAARRLYFDLRFGGWRTYLEDRKAEIGRRLDELQARAKARNTERRELLADQQRLRHFDITTDTVESAAVAKEFEAILADKRVLGVRKHYDSIHVYVQARFQYKGVLYDLGDWLVKVSTIGLTTEEVRTGAKVKWHEFAHPIYRLDEGVFCFGARRATIDILLEKGKLCEAILLAVSCLNTINEDDLHLVSKAFKVIDEPVP